ncbi:ArsR/SmtB family transcription factor [Piscirickettsia litoralis]|uniref:Transcriptional regulator n=1 Tax=Piscirickettsia litoralis TaxID=1891921 RepID=A0ABX3A7Z0_9GAMM|nr:helix-turn-helix domain-containing protein [Piscirickettsia litoralis]ODN42224.1 transcriptional regulator [Piscirickettsia litoralis]
MDIQAAAACMAELGHVKRLAIYRLLIEAGSEGVTMGEVGCKLSIPASTLCHHVKRLVAVGLVEQLPDKQKLCCVPVYGRLEELIGFLTEKCCKKKCEKP